MGDNITSYSRVPVTLDINNYSRAPAIGSTNMPEHVDHEKAIGNLLKNGVRKWEVFPGRNRFCCNGRVMLATQTGIFYFTLFLIIATSICFFAMDGKYTWVEMHPVVPVIAAIQCMFVVVVLCRTALGDPGVIPRASPAEAAALEKLIEKEQAEAADRSKAENLPYRPPPRIRDVTVNGVQFKLKYCFTCKIFRPPRASHCSVCDNCVDRFDHHCPWVGNCVGRRNYKYFYLFLTSLTVYCAYLLSLSVACIVLRSTATSFASAMQTAPLSPVVALVAFFSIWSVAGLGGFHTYLTALNMTTNEDIKGTFKKAKGGNPFSKGSCFKNYATVICGPLPPSLIDRRGWVSEHDLAPANADPNRGRVYTASTTYSSDRNTPSAAPQAQGRQVNMNNSIVRGPATGNGGVYVTQVGYPQATYTESAQISNGRAHSTNPPKYLPPIEHHVPQVANPSARNTEYLT